MKLARYCLLLGLPFCFFIPVYADVVATLKIINNCKQAVHVKGDLGIHNTSVTSGSSGQITLRDGLTYSFAYGYAPNLKAEAGKTYIYTFVDNGNGGCKVG